MFEPGQVVCGGRFRIDGLLGKGNVGTVHRAFDLRHERPIALKTVVYDRGSETSPERFRREGAITATLNYPGIVAVHEYGQEPTFAWLAYELVEGARTLDDLKSAPLRERIESLAAVAEAVGYAHSQGVVHRDLKPANVLVTRDGRIRVADFGLAAARGMTRLTRTGAVVGSPAYMAPEQFQGKDAQIGPETDVWALGVILYELLTDSMPFMGASFWELAARVAGDRPTPPSDLSDGIPSELEDVCFRALEHSPRHRYPDGRAFAADLRCWLVGQPLSAETRRARSSRRRAPWLYLLPLVPLLALAAVAWQTADPSPSADVAPVESDTRAAPVEVSHAWRPTLDRVRHLRLRFVSKTTRPSGTKRRLIEFELEERPERIQGDEARFTATVRRVKIEYGLLHYDSREPDAGLHVADGVEGTQLTYHVNLATGEVFTLTGLDAIGGMGLQKLVGEASENLTNEQFSRHQRALLAVLPPRGFERAEEWQRRVSLWPTAFSGFEVRCRVRREGRSISISQLDAQVIRNPAETKTFEIQVRGASSYDRDRWTHAWWRVECVQQQAEDRTRVEWEMTCDLLPSPSEDEKE